MFLPFNIIAVKYQQNNSRFNIYVPRITCNVINSSNNNDVEQVIVSLMLINVFQDWQRQSLILDYRFKTRAEYLFTFRLALTFRLKSLTNTGSLFASATYAGIL